MWLLESFTHINDALELGMSATVLTRDPEAFAAKAPHLASREDLSFHAGDIRNFAFPYGMFDYILHAATEASAKLNDESPHEMFDTIVAGTRHLLNFAETCGVRKLLMTSSGAVYGRQPQDLTHITEDYSGAPNPLEPGSAYSEGKRVAEHICLVHSLQHRYELKIARCFAFVGPHLPLDKHFAIGNFIRDCLAGTKIVMEGDGTAVRSYLYASDLAVWLWTILFIGQPKTAYNVGSEKPVTIADLASLITQLLGMPHASVSRCPTPRGDYTNRYVPSTRRCSQDLGLQQYIKLKDGVRRTADWYRGLK